MQHSHTAYAWQQCEVALAIQPSRMNSFPAKLTCGGTACAISAPAADAGASAADLVARRMAATAPPLTRPALSARAAGGAAAALLEPVAAARAAAGSGGEVL
jgi:hypothetical protein